MKDFYDETIDMLRIPSIPKKEWDGKSPFDRGIAQITTMFGSREYAICSFNPERDDKPRIVKIFGGLRFTSVDKIWPIPDYMDDDIRKMEFADEESRTSMSVMLQEKEQMVNANAKDEDGGGEWGYPIIHTTKQAVAYLKAKHPKDGIPSDPEVLKAKLKAMYNAERHNKSHKKYGKGKETDGGTAPQKD